MGTKSFRKPSGRFIANEMLKNKWAAAFKGVLLVILSTFLFTPGMVFSAPMPLPTSQQSFYYSAVADSVNSENPAQAKPISVGAISNEGDNFRLAVSLGEFAGPVDIYVGIYSTSLDRNNIFLFKPDNSILPISEGLIPWKSNVVGPISEILIGDISSSVIPKGIYDFYLVVSPSQTMVNMLSKFAEEGAGCVPDRWSRIFFWKTDLKWKVLIPTVSGSLTLTTHQNYMAPGTEHDYITNVTIPFTPLAACIASEQNLCQVYGDAKGTILASGFAPCMTWTGAGTTEASIIGTIEYYPGFDRLMMRVVGHIRGNLEIILTDSCNNLSGTGQEEYNIENINITFALVDDEWVERSTPWGSTYEEHWIVKFDKIEYPNR